MTSRFPKAAKAALALLLVLAECAPPLPTPDTAMRADAYVPGPLKNITVTASMPSAWWQGFGSPALDRLVTGGEAANPGVAQAQQVLFQAQNDAAAANGAFLPQVELNPPGYSSVSRESDPTGPNGYPPFTIFQFTGQVTYDPGLFGAAKYTFENGRALADYQAAALDAARQSLAGNIVAAAIGEAGAEAQIDTTEQIVAAEQRLLTLLNGEYADGAIAQLSLLQEQSQVLATEATLPPLRTQADMQRDRLAILTGRMPADFAGSGIALNDLTVPGDVPVALPSAYLAGRPDLRAALAQVAAQNAALGVAVAHLYPDLTLSANGGYASETLGALFNTTSALWLLAANLLAPLYEGGQLHARKQSAQAQLAAALFAYRGAVLNAFGEAADSLQAVDNDRMTLNRAQDAARTAIAAFNLGAAQFKYGATDYTTVLNAEEVATQQALAQVQARTNLLLDIAKLQMVMAK